MKVNNHRVKTNLKKCQITIIESLSMCCFVNIFLLCAYLKLKFNKLCVLEI